MSEVTTYIAEYKVVKKVVRDGGIIGSVMQLGDADREWTAFDSQGRLIGTRVFETSAVEAVVEAAKVAR